MKIAVLPDSSEELDHTLEAAGVQRVDLAEAEGLIWNTTAQAGFPETLPPGIRWVHLKSHGIRPWIASGQVDIERRWIAAVGAYSKDVAEHAVGLLIALTRQFHHFARSKTWTKGQRWGSVTALHGRKVAIVGCGSIGRALIPMLNVFGAEVVALNRSGRRVEGAVRTLSSEHLDEVLVEADDAIIAGASTEETFHMIGREQLEALGPEGYLVNIARGDLVDADALAEALRLGTIAAAATDVTDPEPLPESSPLWGLPNMFITPHVANPLQNLDPHFAAFVAENLDRMKQNQPPHGLIDLNRSY